MQDYRISNDTVIMLFTFLITFILMMFRSSDAAPSEPRPVTQPQPTKTPPIDRQLLRQRAKILHRIQHGPFHPDLKYMLSCIDHQIACHPRGGFRKGSGLHHDSHF